MAAHQLPSIDTVIAACAAAATANHGQRADEIFTGYRLDRLAEIWLSAQGMSPTNVTLDAVHRRLEELGHVTKENSVGDTAILIAAFIEEMQHDKRRATRHVELPYDMIKHWLKTDKNEHLQPVHFFDSGIQAQFDFLSCRDFRSQFTNMQVGNILSYQNDVLLTSAYMTTLWESDINVEGYVELVTNSGVVFREPVHSLLQRGRRLAQIVRPHDYTVAKLQMLADPPCRLYFHLEGWTTPSTCM